MYCIIGIDIGATNFRIGTVWENGKLDNFEKKSSRILATDNAANNLLIEINSYIEKNKLLNKVNAVTVGVPSCVSKDKSRIITTPNLSGLENIDLKNYLESSLNVPVYLERDVVFLLSQDVEHYNLITEGNETILGMYVGTGFGNGIILNGKHYSGSHGVAGELGHIPLYKNEKICNCGNIGCSESVASGWHLMKIKENYFKNTNVEDIFTYHSNTQIIKEFIDNVGLVAATEINILDPDYVIFAGGVISMPNFPKELLLESVEKRMRKPLPHDAVKFIFSEHGQESGILGGFVYIKNLERRFK